MEAQSSPSSKVERKWASLNLTARKKQPGATIWRGMPQVTRASQRSVALKGSQRQTFMRGEHDLRTKSMIEPLGPAAVGPHRYQRGQRRSRERSGRVFSGAGVASQKHEHRHPHRSWRWRRLNDQEALMFFPEGQVRVFLYGQPVNMRLSFDGLYALAKHAQPCGQARRDRAWPAAAQWRRIAERRRQRL